MLRDVIKIDEEKCTGCGQCAPNCPEGALQIIDGKARLVSDLFCDGLGACIGECPEGAISIEKREAEAYNERKVMENIIRGGPNVIKAHLEHLKGHGQTKLMEEAKKFLKEKGIAVPEEIHGHTHPHVEGHEHSHVHGGEHSHHGGACPGSKVVIIEETEDCCDAEPKTKAVSRLRQWPVQIHLVPENAPYFKDADLLITADCVPFAYAGFHEEMLKGKVLLIGCPKLDDAEEYLEKITNILSKNEIKTVTCAHMEVPCCFGLIELVRKAVKRSGKDIPVKEAVISIRGERTE